MDAFRALVVDDEEVFLETLVKRLRKRNIDTTGVPSGEEALEIMKKNLFDGHTGRQDAGGHGRN